MSVCGAHVCLHMCGYMCVPMPMEVKVDVGHLHNSLLRLICWGRVSQSSPEFINMASLPSWLTLGDPLSLPSHAGVTSRLPHLPTTYMDSGYPASGLHAYTAKALPLNRSPGPKINIFFRQKWWRLIKRIMEQITGQEVDRCDKIQENSSQTLQLREF